VESDNYDNSDMAGDITSLDAGTGEHRGAEPVAKLA